MPHDPFHPDLQTLTTKPLRNRLHHVRASEIDPETAQSEGMLRFAAISGRSVGSEKLWMGETHVGPHMASANHHHGESETAIFVRSGNPEFVFHDGEHEVRVAILVTTSSSRRTYRTAKKIPIPTKRP